MIREAFLDVLQRERPHTSYGRSKLWPSELGGCGRKAMLRINGATGDSMPLQVLEAMRNGVAYEDDTYKILVDHFGATRITTQLSLRDDFWSGKTDFVIDHLTDKPIVVEHKATGDKWWNYNGNLPKHEHVVQLCLYRLVYEEKFGKVPLLVLYYRSWGHYAELVLDVRESDVVVTGEMDGEEFPRRELAINIRSMRAKMQAFYKNNKLPRRVSESDKEHVCDFRGKPSCPYYKYCWPKEATLEEVVSDVRKGEEDASLPNWDKEVHS